MHSFQNLRPDQRMDLHLLEFFRRQSPRLRNNVLRNRQLPNVMQQRRRLQRFHLGFAHVELFGHLDRIHSDPLQMVMRRLVLRLNCQRQRFNRAHVQVRHLFHVPLLV